MKVTDCVWEVKNLGKRTVEIEVRPDDVLGEELFEAIDSEFDYHVFKVAPENVQANDVLCRRGYSLIETQIGLEMRRADFGFITGDSLARYLFKDLDFEDIKRPDQFEQVTSRISTDMFKTDRIALDPVFGVDFSRKRYVNWMTTEFHNQTSLFYQMGYRGDSVGFSMFRIRNGIFYGILGGIYSDISQGLGLLTACAGAKYIEMNGLDIKKTQTAVSSNNPPIIQVYNHCHFNFKNFTHVFIKHLDTV